MADETVAWEPGSTDPKIAFAEFKLHLREITPRIYVVPAVVALNVLVFAVMVATGVSASAPTIPQLLRWGADYGQLTLGGQPWRLVTNVFVHLGVVHILANMAALLSSGAVVERLFGPLAFAALYLAAGTAGSLASTLIHPLVVSAGASGAIFGVYGALGALVLLQRGAIPSVVLSKLGGVAGSFIVYNILFGAAHAGIDNIAHLGGLVGGAAAGALLTRPLIPGRPETTRRPALVAAGALTLGLTAALLLPRPLSYESIVRDFARGEEAALTPYNVAVEQLGRHDIGMEDVANQIERGILPGWRKTRAALERQTGQFLARSRDVSPKLRLALELLDETAVAREEGWTQMVVALRVGDRDRLAAASTAAKEKVERVYQELDALKGD
jgi:rhomboid protease GluP